MLDRASHKAKGYGHQIQFIQDDIFNVPLEKADVIISNYTLQFIRPLQREKLISKIYNALNEGKVFIFSEKVICEDKVLNKQFIDEYYQFKKTQGYSEFEIAQKREALENVLIPYTYDENQKMIKDAGFKHIECIFKWVNFATFIINPQGKIAAVWENVKVRQKKKVDGEAVEIKHADVVKQTLEELQ